jgi:tetratricopeptide (TPR) repeat protein
MVLFDRGDADGAWRHAWAAAGLAPGDVWAHNNLGAALFSRGEVDGAGAHFREAARLAPGEWLPRSNLGEMYRVLGRLDEAEAEYREALARDRRNAAVREELEYLFRLRWGQVPAAPPPRAVPAADPPRPSIADARLDRRWAYQGGYFERRGPERWVERDVSGPVRHFRQVAVTPEYVELADDGRDIGVRLYAERMTLRQPRAEAFMPFRPGTWEAAAARPTAPPPRGVSP